MRWLAVLVLLLAVGCSRPALSGGVRLGPLPVDPVDVRRTQQAVDEGHQPWRRDPLEVAKATAPVLGFNPQTDRFRLLGADKGRAQVEVQRGSRLYIMHLVQPLKKGPAGVWIVESVSAP